LVTFLDAVIYFYVVLVEKGISYPEARKFVFMVNDSTAQKPYTSVPKAFLHLGGNPNRHAMA
jgi:hypothetical protein